MGKSKKIGRHCGQLKILETIVKFMPFIVFIHVTFFSSFWFCFLFMRKLLLFFNNFVDKVFPKKSAYFIPPIALQFTNFVHRYKKKIMPFDFSVTERQHDKTNKITCAPSEDSDQPGHPPSLIRVFAVRTKRPWVPIYPLSAQ